MTTPIERAASYIITKPRKGARTYREYAQDAFDSIDTNQLARIFHPGYGQDGFTPENCAPCREALETALAVKNWLTGKDQQ